MFFIVLSSIPISEESAAFAETAGTFAESFATSSRFVSSANCSSRSMNFFMVSSNAAPLNCDKSGSAEIAEFAAV